MADRAQLDATDRRILELLRENARRTIADIAEHVNLSAAPVKRRIERLERDRVITGYSVEIDEARIGPSLEAFTEIRFSGHGDLDGVIATVTEIPEVSEMLTTAGDTDALVRVRVEDMTDLKRVVNLIRAIPEVSSTRTLMILDRWTRSAPA